MKKLIMIILSIILISCTQIIKQKKVFTLSELKDFKKIQIFPDPTRNSKSHITTKKNKDEDFLDGVMYNENAYPNDSIIHQLDVSSIVGNNKTALIFFVCEWTNGNEEEQFRCYFKPHELNIAYSECYVGYNCQRILLQNLTDENGILDWYHDYHHPFDDRNEFSNPDYHDYGAIQLTITMYYYDNGIVLE